MRDILIIGLIIAVIIILVRIAIGTPMIKRVMETFTSSMINSTTECPMGSQLYMYEGAAFCCSGHIKPDANSLADSCAVGRNPEKNAFCALGPSQKGVPNCLETANNLFEEEGLRFCPSASPNYVKDSAGKARCCASATNATRTECIDAAGSCDVAATDNIFRTTSQTNPSCQFLKAQADDGTCPSSFSPMVFHVGAGPLGGLSLYGCFNPMKGGCLAPATLERLKSLKYDVTGIPVCN